MKDYPPQGEIIERLNAIMRVLSGKDGSVAVTALSLAATVLIIAATPNNAEAKDAAEDIYRMILGNLEDAGLVEWLRSQMTTSPLH